MAMMNAAMTRARVIATFHGNAPSRISCHANTSTGTGPGNDCGDAARYAAPHQIRTSAISDRVRVDRPLKSPEIGKPLRIAASTMSWWGRPENARGKLLQSACGFGTPGAQQHVEQLGCGVFLCL